MIRNSQFAGILFKLLSVLLTSAIAVIDKILVRELSIFQMFFTCSVLSLVILAGVLKLTQKISITKLLLSVDRTYFYGATCSFISLCSFLYAVRSININVVTSIAHLKPLFVLLLAITFLGEKITMQCIVGFILGTLGAYVIVRPQDAGFEQNIVLVFAFIPAIGWALYDFILKKQAMRDHWAKQAFTTALASTVVSLPLGLYNWAPLSTRQCFIFLTLGCFAVLNKISLVNALSRIPLLVLTPIDFMRLVFTASIAYLFLGEKLASTTILGFVLIATATLVNAHQIRKKQTLARGDDLA
jgi:drug/metabolite transporter (DMT)-like permease